MSSDPVFVIAECGSSWRFGDDHVANAYRMIEAAKGCGADACKFQWTSDYKAMMVRRNAPASETSAYQYVQWPKEWLLLFKAKCDAAGIEFMCTAFLPQDVAVIAPLVRRFKVAAKEAGDVELRDAILAESIRPIYVSFNGTTDFVYSYRSATGERISHELHCVSKYPCPVEEIALLNIRDGMDGLSDHTGHVLTGAVAVGAGARVIESHVRLWDTPDTNPDWPHSLPLDEPTVCKCPNSYVHYVSNIRTAERMM